MEFSNSFCIIWCYWIVIPNLVVICQDSVALDKPRVLVVEQEPWHVYGYIEADTIVISKFLQIEPANIKKNDFLKNFGNFSLTMTWISGRHRTILLWFSREDHRLYAKSFHVFWTVSTVPLDSEYSWSRLCCAPSIDLALCHREYPKS